jgi:hypothetical protein
MPYLDVCLVLWPHTAAATCSSWLPRSGALSPNERTHMHRTGKGERDSPLSGFARSQTVSTHSALRYRPRRLTVDQRNLRPKRSEAPGDREHQDSRFLHTLEVGH